MDTVITLTLDDEASYCCPPCDEEELPPPLAALLEEGQTLELAVQGRQLVVVRNPDPRRNTDHLQGGWARFSGYSRGERGDFADTSTLLRVGDIGAHRTTTQARVPARVSACRAAVSVFAEKGKGKGAGTGARLCRPRMLCTADQRAGGRGPRALERGCTVGHWTGIKLPECFLGVPGPAGADARERRPCGQLPLPHAGA